MITLSDKFKGNLAAAFTILVWGTTFIATKVLLKQFNPVEIIIIRFIIGWAVMWLVRPKRLKIKSVKTELLFVLAGLTGVALNYLLETIALMYTQASNLSMIVSTAPLFVGIMAWIVFKQRLKPSFVFGFFICIAGVFLISFADKSNVQIHLIGDLLGIAVALVWAIYSIAMEKIGKYGFDVILTTRRNFFYGILFMLPVSLKFDGFEHFNLWLKPSNLALLLYLAVFACAISFITWNYSLKTIGSVKANLYCYCSPVLTTVFSVIFLHESISGRMLVGMILTLTGVIISGELIPKFLKQRNKI